MDNSHQPAQGPNTMQEPSPAQSAESGTSATAIYRGRGPWSFFVADAAVCLLILLAILWLTIDYAAEYLCSHPFEAGMLALLALAAIELTALYFAIDLAAWQAFGRETVSIADGQIIIENRHRLTDRVRTASLCDICRVEIDSREDFRPLSTVSRLRHMRHRGNIVLHFQDGTRLRLCMATDAATLKSVAAEIEKFAAGYHKKDEFCD